MVEIAHSVNVSMPPPHQFWGGRWFAAKPRAVAAGWGFAATLLLCCVQSKYSSIGILAADFIRMYDIVLTDPASQYPAATCKIRVLLHIAYLYILRTPKAARDYPEQEQERSQSNVTPVPHGRHCRVEFIPQELTTISIKLLHETLKEE